nr:MAG TPA: hypothetical protein [Caudoviricetes sp.]
MINSPALRRGGFFMYYPPRCKCAFLIDPKTLME